jgi:hypothetical protein
MRTIVLGAVIALAMTFSPAATASEVYHRDFSYRSTAIDNRWLPITPGMQFTLQGTASRGGGPTAHEVVLTVTDLAKRVDGVRTLVLTRVRHLGPAEMAAARARALELDHRTYRFAGDVWNGTARATTL